MVPESAVGRSVARCSGGIAGMCSSAGSSAVAAQGSCWAAESGSDTRSDVLRRRVRCCMYRPAPCRRPVACVRFDLAPAAPIEKQIKLTTISNNNKSSTTTNIKDTNHGFDELSSNMQPQQGTELDHEPKRMNKLRIASIGLATDRMNIPGNGL